MGTTVLWVAVAIQRWVWEISIKLKLKTQLKLKTRVTKETFLITSTGVRFLFTFCTFNAVHAFKFFKGT
jgi:hypothetical protein